MQSSRVSNAWTVLWALRQYKIGYAITSDRHPQGIYHFPAFITIILETVVEPLSIMVVFLPRDEQAVVQVFSTLALTANLTSIFHHEFNIGTLAQFGDPDTIARIDHRSERTEFRNMSHYAIRQQLDAENFKKDFILVDENTPHNNAIWWITESDMSEICMDPAISYPGEDYVLWQIHMLIRDLAAEYDGIEAGETFIWDLFDAKYNYTKPQDRPPYDPHDPQQPPFNEGSDYTQGGGRKHRITATYSELIWTDDPKICQLIGLGGTWCVALTREAASLSGLISPVGLSGDEAISAWSPMFQHPGNRPVDRKPRPGDVINLQAYYDWHSPRWPPPGIAAPFPSPTGNVSKVSLIDRPSGYATVGTSQERFRHKLR